MVKRFLWLAVAVIALAAPVQPDGVASEPSLVANATFAPGTIPGTVRYQVMVPGVARADLAATLGALDNLNVVAGPFLAQQMTWYDGRVRAITVLTWVMQAGRPGPIGVAATSIEADGIALESNSVTGMAHSGGGLIPRGRPPLLGVEVSRSQVVVGEVFRVHFEVTGEIPGPLSDWVVQPSFPDAWSVQVPQEVQQRTHEVLRRDEPTVMGAWMVIPSSVGTFTIPPATARRARGSDDMDGLLLGGDGLVSRKTLVEVVPVPEAPAGFFGGIGELQISRRLLNPRVVTGEPALLEVAVAGKGNFPAMAQPPQEFPDGFRVFAAEQEDRWETQHDTLLGERSWRIPMVAGTPGQFVVPEVVLATYHPDSGFREHRLPELNVVVTSGEAPRRVLAPDHAARSPQGASVERRRWHVPALLALGFLAGGVAFGLFHWRRRRLLTHRRLPLVRSEPTQEAEQLRQFLDQWLLEFHGTSSHSGISALVRAGVRPAAATEIVSLAAELERIQKSPGLGDTQGSVASARTRLVRLLTDKVSFPGTLRR